MAAVELATGYVSLAVETSQISKSLGGMFKGADKIAGNTGVSMGNAMSQGFDRAAPDLDGLRKEVEIAEAKITSSIERKAPARKTPHTSQQPH